MEGVKRTNAVVVRSQQQGAEFPQRNPYVMNVDRGRNCYSCGGFGHMVKHCRNRRTGNRIGKGRRLEYEGNETQERGEEGNGKNLNGEQDLILLN